MRVEDKEEKGGKFLSIQLFLIFAQQPNVVKRTEAVTACSLPPSRRLLINLIVISVSKLSYEEDKNVTLIPSNAVINPTFFFKF